MKKQQTGAGQQRKVLNSESKICKFRCCALKTASAMNKKSPQRYGLKYLKINSMHLIGAVI